jgi:hypothetical protein
MESFHIAVQIGLQLVMAGAFRGVCRLSRGAGPRCGGLARRRLRRASCRPRRPRARK